LHKQFPDGPEWHQAVLQLAAFQQSGDPEDIFGIGLLPFSPVPQLASDPV
jgi:hypothetical protein